MAVNLVINIFQNIFYFVFFRRTKVKVWNSMRVSKNNYIYGGLLSFSPGSVQELNFNRLYGPCGHCST